MGLGLCNITKCCTEVCPEHINITDNAIIPLKERVADVRYDPITWPLRNKIPSPPGRRPAQPASDPPRRVRRPTNAASEKPTANDRGHPGGAAGDRDQAAIVDQEREHARGRADRHLAAEEQPELAGLGAEGDLVAEADEAAQGRPGGAGGRRRPQRPVVGHHRGDGDGEGGHGGQQDQDGQGRDPLLERPAGLDGLGLRLLGVHQPGQPLAGRLDLLRPHRLGTLGMTGDPPGSSAGSSSPYSDRQVLTVPGASS